MGEGPNHEKLDWNQLTEEREQVLASWIHGAGSGFRLRRWRFTANSILSSTSPGV